MAKDTTPIEISNNPELLRLAEEVEATNKPRLLKRDNRCHADCCVTRTSSAERLDIRGVIEALAKHAEGTAIT